MWVFHEPGHLFPGLCDCAEPWRITLDCERDGGKRGIVFPRGTESAQVAQQSALSSVLRFLLVQGQGRDVRHGFWGYFICLVRQFCKCVGVLI